MDGATGRGSAKDANGPHRCVDPVQPDGAARLVGACGPLRGEVAERVAGLGLHDYFIWDAIEHGEIEDSPRLLKR